jgi:PhnB protein
MSERPALYPSIIPYLLVADAKALIAFLQAGFGAETQFWAPSETGGVMHAEIKLGNSMLMVSDAAPPAAVSLCHYVPDADAVYARALEAGAVSVAAPETQHYGDRVAGVKDTAGNTWWICTRPAA